MIGLPEDALEDVFQEACPGSRGKRVQVRSRGGRYSRAEPIPAGECPSDLAADASLRAAAQRAVGGDPALPVPRSAWRRKVRTRARRSLVVLLVDASDSMAALDRLRVAKGAALALLKGAYLRRDRAALLVFEGESARTLLPPTQSVELARERLRQIPIGGTTPLSAGLLAAWELVRTERLRDPGLSPTLVLLSDGRANVALDPRADPRAEALALADRLRADGVSALVVDAASLGPTRPELLEIAARLGAHLLRVGPGGVAAVVRAALGA